MLKVCFCAKQVDGLTASRQILTSKKDFTKPPIFVQVQKNASLTCIHSSISSPICVMSSSSYKKRANVLDTILNNIHDTN
jgi:hypothetical protein